MNDNMHWIIQENICQEQKWNELIDSCNRLEIPYSVHKVVPFVGDLIPEPAINAKVVWCFGGISMGELCKRRQWTPGVLELPEYDVQIESPWKQYYLNRDVMFKQLAQLVDDQYVVDNNLYFIKPSNDSKFIAGQLMTGSEIKQWAERIVVLGENDGSNVNRDSTVIISSPKNIRKEARFWIVDDNVVTHSLYKLGSTIVPRRDLVDDNMILAARSLCSVMSTIYWRPADAYCLDIAEVDDNVYKIVEINNINSSGFYDCDMLRLVNAIAEMLSK
jgi:hypothetical protein